MRAQPAGRKGKPATKPGSPRSSASQSEASGVGDGSVVSRRHDSHRFLCYPERKMRAGQSKLTFAEHLEELRRRLGICLLAFLAAVGLSAFLIEPILQWLQRPAEHWLPRFAYFTPTEPLIAYLKVAMLAGTALAMPVILWQVWAFIRAGLTPQERATGAAFILWGSGLFLAGAAFAYYLLLPVSLRVLLNIGRTYLEPVISIDRYLSFVTALLFWCGLMFELPAVVFLLAKIGIVTPAWLKQQRAYAILILTIIAALITPTTDPVNLVLMMGPLIVLYELAIMLSHAAK